MEKMVKLKLFKDNGQYKDDVFVAVNGRTFQIDQSINSLMAYTKNLCQVVDSIAAAFLTGGRRLFLLWKS